MSTTPQIPLPFEMPPRLDFQDGPKSSTLEAVIAQNDDLTARLKVALRRMALMEEELERARIENLALQRENRLLEDQIGVEDGKEANLREVIQRQSDELEATQSQLQSVRGLWAHERDEHLSKIEDLQARLRTRDRQQARWSKHRNNLRLVARRLREHALTTFQQHAQLTVQYNEARERIQVLVDRLQSQGSDYHRQIEQLSFYQGQKINELEAAMQALQSENAALSEKCASMHARMIQQTEIENQIQALERELKESGAWREAAENKSRENSAMLRQIQGLERETARFNSENLELRTRLTEIQSLWEDARSRLEELEVRELSLQQLNQNLAQQLSEVRAKARAPHPQQLLTELDEQLTQILYPRNT
jgi:chromosome segregation ATPase